MIAISGLTDRLRPLAQRLDGLTLRERIFVLAGSLTVLFVAWQGLLMSPLAARARTDEQRLADVQQQISVVDQLGAAASQDPVVAAAARNRALAGRLAELDKDLGAQAQGYIAPQRMAELLRALLAEQHSLKLVSLTNLPVESLSKEAPPAAADAPVPAPAPRSDALKADRGPFLHPVEIVVEGDYASVVAYLRSIERLPWRIHWRKFELASGEYPINRVHLVVGALSLSRDWINL
jgi:MSHA biogenesis protein MshJ